MGLGSRFLCCSFSCINPVVLSMRRVLGHRDAKFSPAHGTAAGLLPSSAHCLLLVLHYLAPVVQAGEGQRSPRDAAAGGAATTLAFVSNCLLSLPGAREHADSARRISGSPLSVTNALGPDAMELP